MNLRLAALFALVLAIAFAAAGYTIGTRHEGVDRATVEAMVQDIMAKSKSAAPASMAMTTPATMAPAGGAAQMAPAATGSAPMAELSDDERHDVESTIRNYLIANPESCATRSTRCRRRKTRRRRRRRSR